MHLKNRYIVLFVGLFFITLINSSCVNNSVDRNNAQDYSESTQETIFTNDQEKSFKSGYDVEDYTIFLTKKQQKSNNEKNMFVNNNFFEPDFTKQKENINLSKKINVIVYSMKYSQSENSYTLGIFVINTSNISIEKMSFDLSTKFKYIDEAVSFQVNLEDEDFTKLPPKGVIVQSISGNVPPELSDSLMKNKTSDITFDLTNLIINGEKVDNLNED
jgi:hypothetical protein